MLGRGLRAALCSLVLLLCFMRSCAGPFPLVPLQVRQQQYSVELGAEGTLRCAFATTHDLLFVLLKREVGGG